MRAVVLASLVQASLQLCCQDHSGACQPYIAALKAPAGNTAYVFDPATKALSRKFDVSDTSSWLARTISPIYTKNSGYAYIMYNDENPIDGSQAGTKAHQKGLLILSQRSALWLVHSVPLWPPAPNSSYSFPVPETRYAQSFLCVSLNPNDADSVGEAFLASRPNVYASNFPPPYDSVYANLAAAASGDHTNSPEPTVVSLTPVGGSGTPFIAFSKSSKWGGDLGEGLVGPYYGTSFAWETWQHGVGNLPTYCPGKHGCVSGAYNLAGVSVDGRNWSLTADHSKWGISWADPSKNKPNGSPSIVCIGDLNRQASQRGRGGGTVCTSEKDLFKAFAAVTMGIQQASCGPCVKVPPLPPHHHVHVQSNVQVQADGQGHRHGHGRVVHHVAPAAQPHAHAGTDVLIGEQAEP